MHQDQCVEIAREAAVACHERHDYMPPTELLATVWTPHRWVIDAMLCAATIAEGERDRYQAGNTELLELCLKLLDGQEVQQRMREILTSTGLLRDGIPDWKALEDRKPKPIPWAQAVNELVTDPEERDFQCIWQAASARNEDDTADAVRFRWLCEHPDWHFIERLCREFVADSNMEFLVELRRVIDARRSVELGPFDEHMPPDDLDWERKADSITRAALGGDVTRPINPNARSIDDL